MKKLCFFMTFMALVALGCAQTEGRKTCDTLKFKMNQLLTSNLKLEATYFDEQKCFDVKEYPYFIPGFCFINCTGRVYQTKDSLYAEFFLICKSTGDTLRHSLHFLNFGEVEAGDTMGACNLGDRFSIEKYESGSYVVKSFIKSTVVDGEFSDSVKELGACVEEFEIINSTGVEEAEEIPCKLYPNPSDGRFTIVCEQMESIRIHNSAGQLVRSAEVHSSVYEMEMSSLSKGVYMAEIKTPKGTVLKRFVLQ